MLSLGAAIWLVSPAHRDMGFSCLGLAVFLGGWLDFIRSKKPAQFATSVIIGVVILWSPCWTRAERSWTEAKLMGKNLVREINRVRPSEDAREHLVIFGWIADIDSCAYPLYPNNLGKCGELTLRMATSLPLRGLKIQKLGDGIFRFMTSDNARFFEWELSANPGVTEFTKKSNRYVQNAVYNLDHLKQNGCDRPIFLYWTGSRLQELN